MWLRTEFSAEWLKKRATKHIWARMGAQMTLERLQRAPPVLATGRFLLIGVIDDLMSTKQESELNRHLIRKHPSTGRWCVWQQKYAFTLLIVILTSRWVKLCFHPVSIIFVFLLAEDSSSISFLAA